MINDLEQEGLQLYEPPSSSLGYKNGDLSVNDHHQKAIVAWAVVVSEDVEKGFLRAAVLGCAIGEAWLVYNATTHIWNYNHHWLETNKLGKLVSVCRQLLPILKQVDLGRYRATVLHVIRM